MHEATVLHLPDTIMSDWRTIEMPGANEAPAERHYAAAIAVIQHAMETRPGTELPPLGQDREHEDWVAEHARYAVSPRWYALPAGLLIG